MQVRFTISPVTLTMALFENRIIPSNPYALGEIRGKLVHFPLQFACIRREWLYLYKQALNKSQIQPGHG